MKSRLEHITNWLELAKTSNFNVQALAAQRHMVIATLERFFVHTVHGEGPAKRKTLAAAYCLRARTTTKL